MPEQAPPLRWEVGAEDAGMRADAFIAARAVGRISRGAAQRWLLGGAARIGGAAAKPARKLRAGEIVEIAPAAWAAAVLPPEPAAPQPQDIPLRILHEDDAIIVVNKPAGMPVHPAPGHAEGTLANALLAHCDGRLSALGGPERPGIVHRLDMDTSGVIIAAKTDAAHASLAAAFAERRTKKLYLALVRGAPREGAGRIAAPIARDPRDRKRMAAGIRGGRESETRFAVLAPWRLQDGRPQPAPDDAPADAALLVCRPITGRTHQIRVHLKHLGHPILGDPIYTRARRGDPPVPGLMLHAWRLELDHPADRRAMTWTAPPPQRFASWSPGDVAAELEDAEKARIAE